MFPNFILFAFLFLCLTVNFSARAQEDDGDEGDVGDEGEVGDEGGEGDEGFMGFAPYQAFDDLGADHHFAAQNEGSFGGLGTGPDRHTGMGVVGGQPPQPTSSTGTGDQQQQQGRFGDYPYGSTYGGSYDPGFYRPRPNYGFIRRPVTSYHGYYPQRPYYGGGYYPHYGLGSTNYAGNYGTPYYGNVGSYGYGQTYGTGYQTPDTGYYGGGGINPGFGFGRSGSGPVNPPTGNQPTALQRVASAILSKNLVKNVAALHNAEVPVIANSVMSSHKGHEDGKVDMLDSVKV